MPAIPSHGTATSSGSWDGPANEARLKTDQDYEYYRKAYAWRDPDGDESNKSTYKFIHHEVDSEGNPGAANIRACQTGIAVLNGARGGTTIPDADRQGVYNHLARHLRDADVEPPELKALNADVERRTYPFEVRVMDKEDKPPIIEGHAAVFNQLSELLWGFRERIAPGAFTRTIREADIRALFNHDPNFVLGRNKAGTLELAEDERGLFTRIVPPQTGLVKDLVLTPMQRGDINQMSFGFVVRDEEWATEDGVVLRTITDVDLFDVSVVTFPAYPQTDAQVRSILDSAGLNYQALTKVLSKASRGSELTKQDNAILKASIDVLASYLPPEPGQVDDPGETEQPQGRTLMVLRRRLELLAKDIV